jgi:hypothetical protein
METKQSNSVDLQALIKHIAEDSALLRDVINALQHTVLSGNSLTLWGAISLAWRHPTATLNAYQHGALTLKNLIEKHFNSDDTWVKQLVNFLNDPIISANFTQWPPTSRQHLSTLLKAIVPIVWQKQQGVMGSFDTNNFNLNAVMANTMIPQIIDTIVQFPFEMLEDEGKLNILMDFLKALDHYLALTSSKNEVLDKLTIRTQRLVMAQCFSNLLRAINFDDILSNVSQNQALCTAMAILLDHHIGMTQAMQTVPTLTAQEGVPIIVTVLQHCLQDNVCIPDILDTLIAFKQWSVSPQENQLPSIASLQNLVTTLTTAPQEARQTILTWGIRALLKQKGIQTLDNDLLTQCVALLDNVCCQIVPVSKDNQDRTQAITDCLNVVLKWLDDVPDATLSASELTQKVITAWFELYQTLAFLVLSEDQTNTLCDLAMALWQHYQPENNVERLTQRQRNIVYFLNLPIQDMVQSAPLHLLISPACTLEAFNDLLAAMLTQAQDNTVLKQMLPPWILPLLKAENSMPMLNIISQALWHIKAENESILSVLIRMKEWPNTPEPSLDEMNFFTIITTNLNNNTEALHQFLQAVAPAEWQSMLQIPNFSTFCQHVLSSEKLTLFIHSCLQQPSNQRQRSNALGKLIADVLANIPNDLLNDALQSQQIINFLNVFVSTESSNLIDPTVVTMTILQAIRQDNLLRQSLVNGLLSPDNLEVAPVVTFLQRLILFKNDAVIQALSELPNGLLNMLSQWFLTDAPLALVEALLTAIHTKQPFKQALANLLLAMLLHNDDHILSQCIAQHQQAILVYIKNILQQEASTVQSRRVSRHSMRSSVNAPEVAPTFNMSHCFLTACFNNLQSEKWLDLLHDDTIRTFLITLVHQEIPALCWLTESILQIISKPMLHYLQQVPSLQPVIVDLIDAVLCQPTTPQSEAFSAIIHNADTTPNVVAPLILNCVLDNVAIIQDSITYCANYLDMYNTLKVLIQAITKDNASSNPSVNEIIALMVVLFKEQLLKSEESLNAQALWHMLASDEALQLVNKVLPPHAVLTHLNIFSTESRVTLLKHVVQHVTFDPLLAFLNQPNEPSHLIKLMWGQLADIQPVMQQDSVRQQCVAYVKALSAIGGEGPSMVDAIIQYVTTHANHAYKPLIDSSKIKLSNNKDISCFADIIAQYCGIQSDCFKQAITPLLPIALEALSISNQHDVGNMLTSMVQVLQNPNDQNALQQATLNIKNWLQTEWYCKGVQNATFQGHINGLKNSIVQHSEDWYRWLNDDDDIAKILKNMLGSFGMSLFQKLKNTNRIATCLDSPALVQAVLCYTNLLSLSAWQTFHVYLIALVTVMINPGLIACAVQAYFSNTDIPETISSPLP